MSATEVTIRVRFEEGTTEWFQSGLVASTLENLYRDLGVPVTTEVISIKQEGDDK